LWRISVMDWCVIGSLFFDGDKSRDSLRKDFAQHLGHSHLVSAFPAPWSWSLSRVQSSRKPIIPEWFTELLGRCSLHTSWSDLQINEPRFIHIYSFSFTTSLQMPELCTQPWFSFLGAFEKLRKVTVRFVLSVRPLRTLRLPLDGFLWNFISF
jgi:hypothetical protein